MGRIALAEPYARARREDADAHGAQFAHVLKAQSPHVSVEMCGELFVWLGLLSQLRSYFAQSRRESAGVVSHSSNRSPSESNPSGT